MKKSFGVAVALTLLAGGIASNAMAANCDSGEMIRFSQNGFAYETNYTIGTYTSAVGSQLSIVGIVDYFCTPLASLVPDANTEYTLYITGLTSQGTVHQVPNILHTCAYTGGTWEIHQGSPKNAPTAASMPALPNATVPANFIDGPIVLSGTLANFSTTITQNGTSAGGSFRADYIATGGTYYSQVGGNQAVFQGVWCPTPKPSGCVPATYSAHPDGKWDAPPTTPTLPSTWGTVKMLYR